MPELRMYSIEDILDELVKKYEVNMTGETARNNYRQQIYRTLHQTKLWDAGVQKGKKRLFTEEQKQNLFSCKQIRDYFRANSLSETIRSGRKYDEIRREQKRRRQEYVKRKLREEPDENDYPHITYYEMLGVKNDIMLEAIFNMFFTPFNEDLLMYDLSMEFLQRNDANSSDDVVEAGDRLDHPEGNYFKRRKDTK
ncbi:MAG: hypothetical protein IJ049_05815 [Oscillospiraceae bacterium]|nr:hypothetical protein [Oscillospiraceae bacterium]